VVIGTDRDRKTGALRALLAHKDSGGLSYAGAAFSALAGDERAQFFAELERLATSWAAFKSSRLMDVKWCHPKLVVEVKHLAGSKAVGHLTHSIGPRPMDTIKGLALVATFIGFLTIFAMWVSLWENVRRLSVGAD
jgi:ATP-dependent DNA ligase